MKTIEFTNPGPYDVLSWMDRSQPTHIEGHILVKIIYAAVNAVDDSVRSGRLPARRSPAILGNEAVGIIVKGNDELSAGTRVIVSCFTADGQIRGIYVDGVWQEYLVVKPEELIPISEHISDEQAAAFPVSFFSAQACLNKADFQPGKSILSLAVGGGVGNAGIQLAKAHGASLVITTAGSTAKAELAGSLGFENIIDLSKEKISEGVARLTDGKGVDIVIDSLGGNLTGDAVHSLSRNGILVAIGYSAGTTFNANITDFVWKGLQMRGQSLNGWFNHIAQKQIWNQLMPLFESGKLKPHVAKIFDAEKVAAAQRYLIEDKPFGKVLLKF
ncbi:NADPH2:quinone reductase [Chitinophaga sp. YR627]|uniref:quinone oxidoreductase family protein n=1 Tax=Chitinophaga sp. YR627 TaxID=1881041 RepID=UPI0008EBE544|nr:zinc-binding alcohol dehydrogenase family protein [Chitinophaga sp. YR627]SFO75466.1 NADPH2:quinone reductase [Chitinophaga sp. YR627]